MNNKRYDCETCISRTTEAVRVNNYACTKAGKSKIGLGGKYYTTLCPANYVSEGAYYVFELYNLFKQGILPASGAVTDQTAWIMEAFAVVSTLEAEEDKQAQAEAKRRSNG